MQRLLQTIAKMSTQEILQWSVISCCVILSSLVFPIAIRPQPSLAGLRDDGTSDR